VRVAIYTRISTDEEHQPYSLEAQDTRLGAYIAGGRLAKMRQRSLWSMGIAIGISVVVVWLFWAVLLGPDRLNAPFF
jgi:hypothetical protein